MVFEKINNVDKPLARMTEKIREKTQCIKLRNKRGDITTDLTEIKKILYEWSHASKLDNLNVINKFLERHNYQNTQEKKRQQEIWIDL